MALPYRRVEAKDWARQDFRGVCNVLMPTFSSDLKRLNEKAIRHDLRRCVELGFWGTLLVSECGTTHEEMKRFMEIAVDERPKGFRLVLHGAFDTVEDVIAMCNHAADLGIEAVLLAYPLTFFPRDSRELVAYTRAVSEGTDLAIILFAVGHWGFRRLHPSQFPPEALEEMADIDTVVALKYECGHPGTGGMVQIQRKLGKKLVVADPMEPNCPAWIANYGMQWMGTSNYEYMGDRVPRFFNLMQEGRWDEAFEIYWAMQPAREAKQALHATLSGAGLIPRLTWKYMAWLNGFNGGPVRMPHMRINGAQMRMLRDGAQRAGLEVTTDPDEAFFVGRNPL